MGDAVPDPWPRDLWLEAIWEDEKMRPAERVVAYAYARYAGKEDTSWCSWAEISRRTGIRSKDTIWRTLTKLEKAGWLIEVDPPRQHRSAVYRLSVPLSRGLKIGPLDDAAANARANAANDASNPEVRNLVARGPIFRNQGSENQYPSTQIDISEENSDTASARRRLPTVAATRRSTQTVAESSALHQTDVAKKIITDEADVDSDTADRFITWLREHRKPKDLSALVRYLADAHALIPLLEKFYVDDEEAA